MADLDPLAAELEALFAAGVDRPLADDAFASWAHRVFAHQFEACPTYRAFATARGITPQNLASWEDVPAVPTTGFKHVRLLAAPEAEVVFRTSGTTRGTSQRGSHFVPRRSLYRASLLPNFEAHLLPDGAPVRLLSLIPSPDAASDSSLSAMIGVVAERLGGARWLAEGEEGIDVAAFLAAAEEAAGDGRPVLLTATAFALVGLLDGLAERGRSVRLPAGTRIMETGGFKGRTREVSRERLYARVEARLGVPAERIVNEYGMTELLSQLYEPVLREGVGRERRHVPPPWLRVRALDPSTLAPLGPGRLGLLAFFDLANAGSVSHVLTEDLGEVGPRGLLLRGRAAGAEPRGCSLAVEELLASSEGSP